MFCFVLAKAFWARFIAYCSVQFSCSYLESNSNTARKKEEDEKQSILENRKVGFLNERKFFRHLSALMFLFVLFFFGNRR